jgi:hypothetical protein
MSDQQQRTQWALDLFHSFVKSWTPPAIQATLLTPSGAARQVIDAIRAIAPQADDTRRVGWAVFARRHDTEYSRERPSGWVHTMVSAVFEEPAQATNALAYIVKRDAENVAKGGERGVHFVICEIQEIP